MKIIHQIPDYWIIIKIPNNIYKVYASWFLMDRWQLNSGITKVEQDDKYYYFFGNSGSCYKCHKEKYGIATLYAENLLQKIINKTNNQIEIMQNLDDFSLLLS